MWAFNQVFLGFSGQLVSQKALGLEIDSLRAQAIIQAGLCFEKAFDYI